jgi:hypothetical protein
MQMQQKAYHRGPELFLLQLQAGALILEKSGHALQVGLQPQFSKKKKKKKKALTKFVHFSLFTITTSESCEENLNM